MIYKNEPEILNIVKNVETIVAPKIGDKGPGGGIVFYIEGNKAYECSELLGDANWENAKTLCTNYRGGGKSDWLQISSSFFKSSALR